MLFDYPFLHVHFNWFSKVSCFLQFEQEEKARRDLEAADDLLNEASSKLNHALSNTPLNKPKCYSCPNDARNCKHKMSASRGLPG